jgi:hypothetical protein
MHHIEVRTDIAAPAEQVWQVLTDFARYPEWNPFVRELTGEVAPGRAIEVKLALGGGKPMPISPVVVRFDAPVELRWRGKLLVPGIFDGEHSFAVEAIDSRRSRLIHAEQFSGILIPVFRRFAGQQTERAFEAMNLALKARVEAAQS